ncbi:hypothetical protein [Nonomuraea sp. bgisy101]|uniref:hypothetical protein n=1 Tax=Nonomuraea sp. bgisy101 TaxID=3413784 RepID=UPI003D705A40
MLKVISGNSHVSHPRDGCRPAAAALTSSLCGAFAFFAVPFSYLVSIYNDHWSSGEETQVDADAVLFILLLSGASTLAAVMVMTILRRHKFMLLVAGIFALLAVFRFASALPFYEG